MAGDLHTHSTCSDGSVPIHRLPLMAARLGLSALALSDHDTTLSAQYAYDHPVQDGVRLIPAAELTGYDFERSHRVHLLTFWPDPWALDRTDPALRRQMVFPLTDEGRAAAAEYLSSAYSADLALWKQRPSILDCEPWSPPPKDEDAESGESK